MNRRLVALLILGVLLVALPQAIHAFSLPEAPIGEPFAALQAQSSRTRNVHAFFSSTNSAGVVTDVDIYATGDPDGGEAVIEVSRYRPMCEDKGCPDVMLHAFNQVPLAAGDLQFAAGLNSATLRATFRLSERLVKNSDTVSIDLTWTAAGRMSRDEHDVGERFQPASASGTIRSGKTNFTPNASIDAQIEEWG
jgi:hypothetical protein